MKYISKLLGDSEISQFLYAIVVIILIPAALSFNTLLLLHNVQQDIDFELNNKAMLVESILALQIESNINNPNLTSQIQDIIKKLPDIKAIEVLRVDQADDLTSLATSTPQTKNVTDVVLNHLAWSSDLAYSKQITASLGDAPKERIWMVAAPIHDNNNKRIGLINVYLSAKQIDAITNRTITDSLIILAITMFGIILLLLNHFRLFEISLLFKKLKDIDNIKDDFISIASHELRAPITAISGYTSMLVNDSAIKQNENLRNYVGNLAINISRLNVLVDDLLTVSRIEKDKLDISIAQCDLEKILDEVIILFTPQAKEKNLDLCYQHADQKLMINADKNKLHEIFSNLVSNAIKYTPTGQINIYHHINNRVVTTYVKDTGVGIAEENKYKLFQKFSRIYNEKTKKIQGTGLGLWITKQLVEKMHGEIYVESIENQGTQFVVKFPLV